MGRRPYLREFFGIVGKKGLEAVRVILGIGVDITEIARVGKMLERQGASAWERILAPVERREFGSDKRRVEYLAGRFAAKEAAAKALGTGIGKVGFHDLAVVADEHGAPQLLLQGYAADLARVKGIVRVHVSISHSEQYAVAQVVLEG
jgi:holo-[acyl-carrier protein] synthase